MAGVGAVEGWAGVVAGVGVLNWWYSLMGGGSWCFN